MKDIETLRKSLNIPASIKAPNELFAFIKAKVVSSFRLTYLSIFILNDSETKYSCFKNITAENDSPKALRNINLSLKNPVVSSLLSLKKAISAKEIARNLTVALTEERRSSLLSSSNELGNLGAQACIPGFINDKLFAIFVLGEKESKKEFFTEEIELLSSLAEKSTTIIHNFQLLKKEINLFAQSIRQVNKQMETKDIYTRGHSHRVGEFSVITGNKLQDELIRIPYGEIILYYAAEFHDVGKINMSDVILKKEDSLSITEHSKIEKHPVESMEIIKPMEKWFGKIILDAVSCHHENYDGTGYPYGKKGEEINILARIIRVADSFDAMITDRPYRKALVQHKALLELKKGRGTQFCPKVLDAFLDAYREGLFSDIFFSNIQGTEK